MINYFKVPRPDGKEDYLGLAVVDEPSSRQSDPHVLKLQIYHTSKQPISTNLTTVRKIKYPIQIIAILL